MTRHFCTLISVLGLLLLLGCGDRAPESLSTDQLPAAVEKAFAKGKPDLKAIATEAVEAFQKKDLTRALSRFQSLSSSPELTTAQRGVVGQCLMTVNEALRQAQAQGDAKADAAVRLHNLAK